MKKIKFLLLIFISIFVLNINSVKAADTDVTNCQNSKYACAVCIYSNASFTQRFVVSSDGSKLSMTEKYTNTDPSMQLHEINGITANSFKSSSGGIECPSRIYYDVMTSDGIIETAKLSFTNSSNNASASLSTSTYNNNLTITGVTSATTARSVTCPAPHGSLVISDNNIEVRSDSGYSLSIGSIKASDFKKADGSIQCRTLYAGCYLYHTTYLTNACTLYLGLPTMTPPTSANVTTEIMDSNGTVIDPSNNSSNTGSTNTGTTNTGSNFNNTPDVEGCEVLGNRFFKYVQSALGWIQIAGPILAMILSMVDFAQAILSGEEDAKKKAIKNTKTRFIAAFLLVIVPLLIKFILSLVDDLNGTTCNL